MLISRVHGLAFVHIPKCGGMTVKQQFGAIDDSVPKLNRTITHPTLGPVRLGHLPLWALCKHYPEHFSAFAKATSYAICRDPYERFESGLSQHLQQHRGVRINAFSTNEVRKAAYSVIDHLTATHWPVDDGHCHFIPQSHFVFLDGQRMVDRLYPISQIPVLISDLARATGIPAASNLQANQTLDYRVAGSDKILRRISSKTRKMLPIGLHARMKAMAKALLVRGSSRHMGFSRKDPRIAEFIARYYGTDIDLFEKVSAVSEPASSNSSGPSVEPSAKTQS